MIETYTPNLFAAQWPEVTKPTDGTSAVWRKKRPGRKRVDDDDVSIHGDIHGRSSKNINTFCNNKNTWRKIKNRNKKTILINFAVSEGKLLSMNYEEYMWIAYKFKQYPENGKIIHSATTCMQYCHENRNFTSPLPPTQPHSFRNRVTCYTNMTQCVNSIVGSTKITLNK